MNTRNERRKHRRVKASSVASHVRVKDEVMAMGLPIDNISIGGLFIRTDTPLPAGTPVVLELMQPSLGTPLKVVGTAVLSLDAAQARATGAVAGMGVRFEPLSSDVASRLRALLATLASEGKSSNAIGHNPAEIGAGVEASRQAFDFSFISLDAFGDDDDAPLFVAPAAPGASAGGMGSAARQQIQSPERAPAPENPSQLQPPASSGASHPGLNPSRLQSPAASGASHPGAASALQTPAAAATATAATTASRAPEAANPAGGAASAPPAASPPIPRGNLKPPVRIAVPIPPPPAPAFTPAPGPVHVDGSARLMVQVRGLLQDLDETRLELERRGDEILRLRDETVRLTADLQKKDARIAELELRLAQR